MTRPPFLMNLKDQQGFKSFQPIIFSARQELSLSLPGLSRVGKGERPSSSSLDYRRLGKESFGSGPNGA